MTLLLLALLVAEPCYGHRDTAIRWNAYTDATVTHFEIERAVAGVNAWSVAGDTKYKNRPAYMDGAVHVPAFRAETWDVLRAWSLPAEGVTYSYRVRAVRGNGAKSLAPSNVVTCAPQDPTRCYPVACP